MSHIHELAVCRYGHLYIEFRDGNPLTVPVENFYVGESFLVFTTPEGKLCGYQKEAIVRFTFTPRRA